jgi:hypothetical protein
MTACPDCARLQDENRRLRRLALHQQRVLESVRVLVARRRLPRMPRQTLQLAKCGPNGQAERSQGGVGAERAVGTVLEAAPGAAREEA